MPSFITFKDVKKTYTMGEVKIHALDGVSFSIDQGEFVIIAGASGAGKSTILNLLGGMDTVTEGDIIVDGQTVSAYNEKEMTYYRRYDVGFVFQFYNLVQNLTLRENVELATQICKEPLDIEETIRSVGLEERMDNFPSQLSGGEQQRVAIARALAMRPALILADEPTGNLDTTTSHEVMGLIRTLAAKLGQTLIVVTHDIDIAQLADRIVEMRDGRIVKGGGPNACE